MRKTNELIGLSIVGALVLGWAASHLPLWSAWAEQQRLARHGHSVSAEIFDRSVTDGRFADTYYLDYRFRVAETWQEGRDSVSWHAFERARPAGSRVDVRYDPADPGTSMVAGNDPAGRLLKIYAAIDLLLLFAIGRGVIRARREAKAGLS